MRRTASSVITSYSIHYTKLYDKGQTNLSLEMARCLLELQSQQSIHIDLQPVKLV